MLKRGLIIVGVLALLGGLFGCAKEPPMMLDGPGMVHIPEEDMVLFGTWTNEDESVQLVIEGDLPFLTIFVDGEKTFESSTHVDPDNGNALDFYRDDGEIIPLPYESFRIDPERDVIYGTQAGVSEEEPFHRADAME